MASADDPAETPGGVASDGFFPGAPPRPTPPRAKRLRVEDEARAVFAPDLPDEILRLIFSRVAVDPRGACPPCSPRARCAAPGAEPRPPPRCGATSRSSGGGSARTRAAKTTPRMHPPPTAHFVWVWRARPRRPRRTRAAVGSARWPPRARSAFRSTAFATCGGTSGGEPRRGREERTDARAERRQGFRDTSRATTPFSTTTRITRARGRTVKAVNKAVNKAVTPRLGFISSRRSGVTRRS